MTKAELKKTITNLNKLFRAGEYSTALELAVSLDEPAVMESVLACIERDESGNVTKLDPVEVMEKAISKYEVVDPFASRT